MTIIGVIICFRGLAQEALADVLDERIPFLLSSVIDFKHHIPSGDSMVSLISALYYKGHNAQFFFFLLLLTFSPKRLKTSNYRY